MASLSEMLITPRSAAVPWVVLASCAVADPIPKGIDAIAKELLPIRETLKLKILFILHNLLSIRRATGMARASLVLVYTFHPSQSQ